MKILFMLVLISYNFNLFAGRFCVVNQNDSPISHEIKAPNKYTYNNLRMRLVANSIFKKNKKEIFKLLQEKKLSPRAAIIPYSNKCFSYAQEIWSHSSPTNKLTLVMTADIKSAKNISKKLILVKNIKLTHDFYLEKNQNIIIYIKKIWLNNNKPDIDFDLKLDCSNKNLNFKITNK